jgi:phosphoglycolate phosphatase
MVIGAGGDIPRKPDPKGALLISEKMGIAPEELMYVGDSGVDMETANNSGMHAVGVLWGFRDMEELLENGAQTIIHHPMDLIQSLD